MSVSQRRVEQAAATREALVAAGRRLFASPGYFATSTEDLVEAAGVGTRGALYHHFADKRDLFLAVFHQVERDLASQAEEVRTGPVSLDSLRAGLHGYLEAAANHPEVQRIILVDGPSVLGWGEWRTLEEHYGLGTFRALLEQGMAAGTLRAAPLEPLAHLLLASVNESALYIANSADPRSAKKEARVAIDRLLDGLKPN
jgi:AcrR family transcriptional regulator